MEARARDAGSASAFHLPLVPVAAVLSGLLVLSLAAFWALRPGPDARPAGGWQAARVAYIEFGFTADTLWTAPADRPGARRKVFEAPHAPSYGIVGSLSPDQRLVAFTSLAPDTRAPGPDAPADLYTTGLTGGTAPAPIARGVDLLVRPLWTPSQDGLVVRRSAAAATDGYSLVEVPLNGGAERVLVSSPAALFAIAFMPGSGALLYVRISRDGSDLFSLDRGGGSPRRLARLADDLTRDWTLSPTGDRLAYLALSLTPDGPTSTALVLDLASGRVMGQQTGAADDFGPAWTPDGALTLGRLVPGQNGKVVSGGASLTPPAHGFDVPLGWSPDGGALVVRTFEGSSAAAPGRSVLSLIRGDGSRLSIAGGEVTFLGWLYP